MSDGLLNNDGTLWNFVIIKKMQASCFEDTKPTAFYKGFREIFF